MQEEPKNELMVTIRCLAYNHEPYIRQCLEGFVMQKTNFRFEAIVHDDASTDGTADIIKEYAEKYPDIIKPIFETENQYSKRDGSIRRIMDEHTHGKYVALCEGDDYWIDPLKLQKQVDFLEQNLDYSMCFHNAIIFNCVVNLRERIKSFNSFSNDKDLQIEDVINQWNIPTASILYRRVARKETPVFFSGDYVLSLSLASSGKVHYIDQYMSVYRLNEGGVSVNVDIRIWSKQMLKLLKWYDEYTQRKYTALINRRIERIRLYEKYSILKDKCIMFPFILMPRYTCSRIIEYLKKRLYK